MGTRIVRYVQPPAKPEDRRICPRGPKAGPWNRLVCPVVWLLLAVAAGAQTPQWTPAAATEWYAEQPWMVGANYIPAYAVNQLEMWQGETFDAVRIDLELGWAENLGMTTVRVFLHDLVWKQDPRGFRKRIDKFLSVAEKHKIRPVLVLLDSCWNPFPEVGIQPVPRPGVHNSGWVQSPGARVLKDKAQYDRVLAYVQDVILAFSTDKRILAWDLWNEPDNTNSPESYGKSEPVNKVELVRNLLPKVFQYARAGIPTQPLTSGLWQGDWSSPDKLSPVEKIQVELSDVISFHSYDPPEEFEKRVRWLQQYNRPILCTEYMARPRNSTLEGILPIAKKYKVAAINWGLVAGKTQTWFPWDSWQKAYTDRQPTMWFHDILYGNGKPYSEEETEFLRSITGHSNGKPVAVSRGKQ